MVWDDLGKHKKAIEYLEQALSIDREVYSDKHPDVATDLNNIGTAWYALGDLQRAKTCFQQAYSILREFYGDEHPRTRTVRESLEMLRGRKSPGLAIARTSLLSIASLSPKISLDQSRYPR